ncbi:MAG: glyoxalase/bleomycin resistance/dioxygenase family protein [Actinomycetota bacterium]|nr:glyoxalase/bleomycin resistance/dioxygenase family protein [Actinomycetota bacterium]
MHRSRIGVVLLDFPGDTHDDAQRFWSGAVGHDAEPEDNDPDYALLGPLGTLKLFTQRIGQGTPARVHLDIETDNVAAEVARLTALGATIGTEMKHYTVMRDPSGMVFCVVPVQTGDAFAPNATEWP